MLEFWLIKILEPYYYSTFYVNSSKKKGFTIRVD